MNRTQLVTQLLHDTPAEKVYRTLYQHLPYTPGPAFPLVRSWNEFVSAYTKKAGTGEAVPKQPPTPIAAHFSEAEFFPATGTSQSEIIAFKHLRYTPAFIHSMQFVKLAYILAGHCLFYLNGQTRTIHQGSLLIIGPNIDQAFFVNDAQTIVINIIMRRSTFEAAFSPLLMASNTISDFFWQMLYGQHFSDILLFPATADVEIQDAVLHLYDETQADPPRAGRAIIMNSYVLLLFGQLVRRHLDAVAVLTGSQRQQKLPAILQYIHAHQADIKLPAVAARFNLSDGYLSRYIKEATGVSFSALLQQLRLREAAQLLATTRLSIEAIVAQVGYGDVSHFYRIFRARYGVTPGQYRVVHKGTQMR
ncbi:helix-turn-helix transcriptional regulator [Schleiferilactobacillus shenzhenensis]|uniref:HTH araC/xylS-type domain-containing protein n=1 Tax=Schleiferilactobacillus shenzhenensis LY-73 TaxID=1231336 RepID=U4TM48_9LACO|nr:AraC family transcriptional regulator [Schleiferilactobacillus shenzhenensis]ERL65941.1 hypothetical protein L248_2017 [Schleiferilactobacillus shenzhenensis LY-73]